MAAEGIEPEESKLATEGIEPEESKLSFFGKIFPKYSSKNSDSGGIDSGREPLVTVESADENYSVRAAILPFALQSAINNRVSFRFLFPALGGLLYGYDIGATSGATISLESATLSGTTWYNLSSVEIGLVVSGSLFGALIGSLLAFNIADFLGRRRELIFSSVLYFVGALATAIASNFPLLVIGRFVFGIGIGLAMHAAPMYISETAPYQIRGMLISLKEFFIVLGMLLGYTVSSLAVNAVAGWRYIYAASAPLSVIMGIGMWWLPPSPRWLLLRAIQGKGSLQDVKEAAICAFCRLRGQANDSLASEQIDEILVELSYADQVGEGRLWEVFQGKCLKALYIGAGLVLFQQVTGQPSVLYYAATILQVAGFSAASDATRVSILLGLLKLITTGIAVLVVDRLGRRPLLIGGVSGIAISLFLLAAYYSFLNDAPVIAVIALLLYVGCYQLSFGPIGWLLISEIFPLRQRGRGLSIAVLVNFASNALVTFSYAPLQTLLGAGTVFAMFGVIAILSLVFIFFCVPETKGLSLEEIESKIL